MSVGGSCRHSGWLPLARTATGGGARGRVRSVACPSTRRPARRCASARRPAPGRGRQRNGGRPASAPPRACTPMRSAARSVGRRSRLPGATRSPAAPAAAPLASGPPAGGGLRPRGSRSAKAAQHDSTTPAGGVDGPRAPRQKAGKWCRFGAYSRFGRADALPEAARVAFLDNTTEPRRVRCPTAATVAYRVNPSCTPCTACTCTVNRVQLHGVHLRVNTGEYRP
jgi:hypothetical protein